MQLAEILNLACVAVPLQVRKKDQAISELITLLDNSGQITNAQVALQAVMDREAIRSTGIGQGFAIPHGKCNAAKKLVMAIGKLDEPIDFDSIDQKPVTLIALLVSPVDKTGPHIQALAKISRVMADSNIRQQIWDSKSPQQLYDLLTQNQD
jgi:fructose-specific phosphotransferase system IIA component